MSEALSLEGVLFGEPAEGRAVLEPSQGEVPAGLCGSYYLNGPANLQRGDFRYRHWLDGDGFVRAVHFDEGRAELVSRFVRTRKYEDEVEAGKTLYRGFGTSFPDDRLRRRMALETPANVSIYPFGGRLLAFGEQALPWELDEDSLKTVGEFNFGGELIEISPFSAHPKIDEKAGRLCNFGLKYLLGDTTLCYWEFDDSFQKVMAREFPCPRPISIHDFALSAEHAVFYMSPYDFDIGSFARKGTSIQESLSWHADETNSLFLIPRDGTSDAITIDLGVRGYCLHMIGAYTQGDKLIVDLIETSEPLYPQYEPLPELFSTVQPGGFVRLTVSPADAEVCKTESYPYPDAHMDFPVSGAPNRGEGYEDTWVLSLPVYPRGETKYFDRLQRFNWKRGVVADEYRAPEGSYLAGEVALMGVTGERDEERMLVFPLWSARRRATEYLIFRAYDLAAGPLATLPVPCECPLAFHGCFNYRS